MNFLFDSIAEMISNLASGVSTNCAQIYFEPQKTKSLREE